MKKFILASAVLFVGVGLLKAEQWESPSADTLQPISVAYGGTKYSIANFSAGLTTAAVGPAVFMGVHFSTGNQADTSFVEVWDSTGGSLTFLRTQPTIRVYNIGVSTNAAGSSAPIYPIRFKNGIIWKAGTAAYNSIVLQYWQSAD